MAPSLRDRLSVDLQGLKAALVERALLAGTSPLGWVRATLAEALGGHAGPFDRSRPSRFQARDASRVRFTLRMSRADASAVLTAARLAGQPRATSPLTCWRGNRYRCRPASAPKQSGR